MSPSASFSARELSLMKAAGACSGHGVHKSAMHFEAILKCSLLGRLSDTVTLCTFLVANSEKPWYSKARMLLAKRG